MRKSVKKALLILGATAFATSANAAATLTAPTFSLDDVAVVAGALLLGLAGLWAIKAGLRLVR
jgi:hypothetical protein